jgi:glutathione S-transferase
VSAPVTIIGSYVSPYVRKVLVVLDLKGIPYRIDPIIPFFGTDRFTALSPVRRIPVLVDDCVSLADSTVICEYLEERYPRPALLPQGPDRRARARWLEEFADTRMGEVFIWRLFNQVVINRFVWGEATDEDVLRKALDQEIPAILDYLEREVPGEGFLFGEIGLPDIAIGAFFRNASFADFSVDPGRWPVTACFVSRVLEHPSFVKLRAFEELLLRTPIPNHRDALRAAGAPLTPETVGSTRPRRGILAV